MEAHSHTLEITPTGKFGPKGEKYEVRLNGELIASGHSPEHAACRILQQRGAKGMVYFRRPGRDSHDLAMSIGWGAAHTVSENTKTGPRFAKWVENDFFKVRETSRLTGGIHDPIQ